jgi:hypothetical protein
MRDAFGISKGLPSSLRTVVTPSRAGVKGVKQLGMSEQQVIRAKYRNARVKRNDAGRNVSREIASGRSTKNDWFTPGKVSVDGPKNSTWGNKGHVELKQGRMARSKQAAFAEQVTPQSHAAYRVQKGMRLPDGRRVRFLLKKTPRSDMVLARTKGEKNAGVLVVAKPNAVSDTMNFHGPSEIKLIQTRKDLRRKGLATGMYQHAKKRGLDPQHSTAISEEGKKWASSLSKGLPSYLRNTPKGVLSPGLKLRVRQNESGKTMARNISRAAKNPRTPKPYEAPKQLPLLNRNGTKVTPNQAAKAGRKSGYGTGMSGGTRKP